MPSLEQLAHQLESPNSRDRLLALAALRDVPSADAVPLIKKSSLGRKSTDSLNGCICPWCQIHTGVL